MIIFWLPLILGALAMLVPFSRLFQGSARLRTYDQFTDLRLSGKPAWSGSIAPSLLYAVQGFAAGLFLRHAFAPGLVPTSFDNVLPYAVAGVAVGLGQLVSMFARASERKIEAPAGLMIGIDFAFLPIEVALPTAILSVASVFAARSIAAFYIGGGLCAAVTGYSLLHTERWMLLTCALHGLPVGVAFLSNRRLALVSTRATSDPVERSRASATPGVATR